MATNASNENVKVRMEARSVRRCGYVDIGIQVKNGDG